MALTWIDWIIVAAIAISGLISLKRGFVKEALSLVTWIVAGIVAWMFGGLLAPHLTEYIATPSVRVMAASAILFVVILLVGALVNGMLGALIRVTGLAGTDRFLGIVFGVARGTLLVVVVVGLLSLAPVQGDVWWQESVLIPHFLKVADWSKELAMHWGLQWVSEIPAVPMSVPAAPTASGG